MTSAPSPVLPPDREVDAGGLRTHYLEAGEGDALLLLHGSGPGVSAASNWGGVIDALAEHRRVIAMDFAGFGDSEKTRDGAYDIKLWQRQLLAFLDALELASVPIVGNSFGGAMALAASMRHPDRVERLVLMGTPVGEYPLTDGLRGAREYDGTRKNLREVLERLTYDPSLVTEEMLDRRHASSVVPHAQDALRALIPASVPGSKSTIVKGIPEHHLASVRAPTLVLHGRDDRVVPFELGLRLLNGIEDSELHAFGRCGHWVQLERRDAFLRLVLEFVGRAR
jgi:2-hydroxy-6-oxo-octa-2,4-dienoate hydrolase